MAAAEKKKVETGVDGSHSEEIPFHHVEIHVGDEAQKVIPKIPTDAFDGAGAEGDDVKEDDGGVGEIPDDIDLDSFKSIMQSGINIPALYFGSWWLRTPEQCDIFSTELYYYCQKKGINIRDYLFDELPLLFAAIHLGGGIYTDYKEFKKTEKKEIDVDKDRLEGEKEEEKDETGK